MIENICIKNTACYDEHGVELKELKKVNFVYGANGTGKTTISNLSTNRDDPEFQDCSIQWSYGQELQCLVYNKKFRKNNFGKGKIAGVFTLGEATKEEIRSIQEKQGQLAILKADGLTLNDTCEKQKTLKLTEDSEFKERVWKKI